MMLYMTDIEQQGSPEEQHLVRSSKLSRWLMVMELFRANVSNESATVCQRGELCATTENLFQLWKRSNAIIDLVTCNANNAAIISHSTLHNEMNLLSLRWSISVINKASLYLIYTWITVLGDNMIKIKKDLSVRTVDIVSFYY